MDNSKSILTTKIIKDIEIEIFKYIIGEKPACIIAHTVDVFIIILNHIGADAIPNMYDFIHVDNKLDKSRIDFILNVICKNNIFIENTCDVIKEILTKMKICVYLKLNNKIINDKFIEEQFRIIRLLINNYKIDEKITRAVAEQYSRTATTTVTTPSDDIPTPDVRQKATELADIIKGMVAAGVIKSMTIKINSRGEISINEVL